MAKQWWCIPCRSWHENRVCPECGVPAGSGANAFLYTTKLNNHLYAQAESAEREKKIDAALRRGYELEPPRWAKQAAKKIVADL